MCSIWNRILELLTFCEHAKEWHREEKPDALDRIVAALAKNATGHPHCGGVSAAKSPGDTQRNARVFGTGHTSKAKAEEAEVVQF